MRAACTSPGSRSAPLVLSLAREPRLRCYSHVDERCAGFFALGLAKASGLPVAVACTSGTAAAELLPAAIEAREARVPLLLLTADRPAELRENGAGQAIDQLKLFGGAAKWFFEVGVHEAGAGAAALDAHARLPRLLDGAGGQPGRRAPELPAARAAGGRGASCPRTQRTPGRARRTCAEPARRGGPAPADASRCAELVAGRAPRCARRRAPRAPVRGLGAAAARASRRPPAGRCWPTRCRARGAARRRSPTTTRCCATRTSRPRCGPTWSCGSAICRSQSRCAAGSRASAAPPGRARSRGRLAGPGLGAERLARARARRRRSRADRAPAPSRPRLARRPSGLAGELAQRR